MESSTSYRRLGRTMPMLVLALGLLAGLIAVLAVAAPNADAQSSRPDGPQRVFALSESDDLLLFDADEPRDVRRIPITGLRNGESLVDIDFRPANGKLYGIGDKSYVYNIGLDGMAKRGARITADGDTVVLKGTRFGIDFNPTVDRLRIVSDAGQNLRINVENGVLSDRDENPDNGTQPDRKLRYAEGDPNEGRNPRVTAVAYRNSQPGAFGTMNTELYDIDVGLDILATQAPPNDGVLNTDGPLGRNFDAKLATGFDIVTRGGSPSGDRAFAALQMMNVGVSNFYSINLNSGRATKIDRIGDQSTKVKGLAIPIGQR